MSDSRLNWAMPVMRAGYAGRALTYLAIAGLSLWAIWQGGEAQGTSDSLKQLETAWWGVTALVLIGVGLLCYAVWRLLASVADLEDHGTDGKGIIARTGMIVTGLIHAAIGGFALMLVIGRGGDSGEGSTIAETTATIMQMPMGDWIIGAGGLVTLGAGIYYLHKAWTQSYREKLAANHFTAHWNPVLRAGVAAQGVVIAIVGVFLLIAAWQHDPNEAGGMDKTFDWLSGQIYGQVLVTALCAGLLAFALFLAVNAVYRVIPGLRDPDMPTLAEAMGRA